jgi:hypothetical protein
MLGGAMPEIMLFWDIASLTLAGGWPVEGDGGQRIRPVTAEMLAE